MLPRRFLLLTLTIALGITLRRVPLGLPAMVTKYGGSMLWALMIYLLTAMLAPRLQAVHAAMVASAIATAIELFKLVHTPDLDAFRLTLPGILLLGRLFSPWDLLAYYAAIALAARLFPPSPSRTFQK
jgi:hypothetical protein